MRSIVKNTTRRSRGNPKRGPYHSTPAGNSISIHVLANAPKSSSADIADRKTQFTRCDLCNIVSCKTNQTATLNVSLVVAPIFSATVTRVVTLIVSHITDPRREPTSWKDCFATV